MLRLCLRLYFRVKAEGETVEDEECRTLEARAKRRQACLLKVIMEVGAQGGGAEDDPD